MNRKKKKESNSYPISCANFRVISGIIDWIFISILESFPRRMKGEGEEKREVFLKLNYPIFGNFRRRIEK